MPFKGTDCSVFGPFGAKFSLEDQLEKWGDVRRDLGANQVWYAGRPEAEKMG